MELKALESLMPGDVVRYTGPKANRGALTVGDVYEVVDVDAENGTFQLEYGYVVGNNPFAKEWDISSYERIPPVARLHQDDYGALIDCALETNDYEWFKELYVRAFAPQEFLPF